MVDIVSFGGGAWTVGSRVVWSVDKRRFKEGEGPGLVYVLVVVWHHNSPRFRCPLLSYDNPS